MLSQLGWLLFSVFKDIFGFTFIVQFKNDLKNWLFFQCLQSRLHYKFPNTPISNIGHFVNGFLFLPAHIICVLSQEWDFNQKYYVIYECVLWFWCVYIYSKWNDFAYTAVFTVPFVTGSCCVLLPFKWWLSMRQQQQ